MGRTDRTRGGGQPLAVGAEEWGARRDMIGPDGGGTPPLFRLSQVSYTYPEGTCALRDVSLTVDANEKVAILGANGCGKSTLVRILGGLLFPQTGTVEASGSLLSEAALQDERFQYRFRQRVGFVFQNSDAQLFSSTVREEIAFGPLHLRLPEEEILRRIADVANLLDIASLLDRPPFQLSGGEKKKVAIAATLAANPLVILLDEPTNGLDPRAQRFLVELLNRLHAAGKTLVTATHALDIVPTIADRVVVFAEDHTIAAHGPTERILGDLALLARVNLI